MTSAPAIGSGNDNMMTARQAERLSLGAQTHAIKSGSFFREATSQSSSTVGSRSDRTDRRTSDDEALCRDR